MWYVIIVIIKLFYRILEDLFVQISWFVLKIPTKFIQVMFIYVTLRDPSELHTVSDVNSASTGTEDN